MAEEGLPLETRSNGGFTLNFCMRKMAFIMTTRSETLRYTRTRKIEDC